MTEGYLWTGQYPECPPGPEAGLSGGAAYGAGPRSKYRQLHGRI